MRSSLYWWCRITSISFCTNKSCQKRKKKPECPRFKPLNSPGEAKVFSFPLNSCNLAIPWYILRIWVNTSSFAWINLPSLEQIYSRFSTSCQMIFFWGRITCSFCVWGLCLKESGSLGVKISGCATWLGTDLHFCFSANRVRKQLLHFAKRSWNDGGNDPFVSSPFIGFNAIRNPTCLNSMPRVMENFTYHDHLGKL